MHPDINRELCQKDPKTRTKMVIAEKQEQSDRTDKQSNSNRNTIHRKPELRLTQDEKMNVETLKKMMSEMKTTLTSLRNQNRKTF